MATKTKTAKAPSLPKAELPHNIDSLAALVLASLPGVEDDQRDDVGAGDHKVDMVFTVRVCGELRVGADTTTKQVNRLKPWTLARLLANKVPAAVLDECIGMALSAAKSSGKESPQVAAMEAEADDLKGRVEAVFEQAGQTVDQTRRGSVRLHGTIGVEVAE
jgi:hypothetical protein